MRTLLTLALVLGLATSAAAEGCVTVNIDHSHGQPTVESVDNPTPEVRYSINGSFVWFTWNQADVADNDGGLTDTASWDVSDPDVVSAVGCPDGDVTINRTVPEPVSDEPKTPPVTVAETENAIEYLPQLFGSFGRYLMD